MKRKFYLLFGLCFVGVIVVYICYKVMVPNERHEEVKYNQENFKRGLKANEYYVKIKGRNYVVYNFLVKSCFSGKIIKRLVDKNIFLEKYVPTDDFIMCIKKNKIKPQSNVRIHKGDWYLKNGYLYYYKGSYFIGKDIIKITK